MGTFHLASQKDCQSHFHQRELEKETRTNVCKICFGYGRWSQIKINKENNKDTGGDEELKHLPKLNTKCCTVQSKVKTKCREAVPAISPKQQNSI